MPFFSVIIPLYNKEKYIENTVKSVLNQSFDDFEIIIVDDGSTDSSKSVVSKITDARIKLISQKNLGASITRNNAISAAIGKHIAPLDADDIWKDNHLYELHKCINKFSNAVLFCNHYEIKRNNGFITDAVFNFKFGDECLIIDDFFKANIINFIPSSSSVAYTKANFLKIKGYDTTLRSGQDIDLWIKFGLLGDIAFNPKITMRYNLFDASSLSNKEYNEDRFNLINKYLDDEKNNDSLKLYLDINRYALNIRSKIHGPKWISDNVLKSIDKSNLNTKQRILLNFPVFLLKIMKKLQRFLIDKKIYLSAFK